MDLASLRHAQFAADLAELCSPLLAGRLSGTPGARLAADYLAGRMLALGLHSDDGDFRQPVSVPATRLLAAPRLQVGGRMLQHRREFAEIAPLSTAGRVRAPLRVVDQRPLDVAELAGRVLLIAAAPADLDLAATAAAAAELGAAAVLVEAGEPNWFYKTVHTGAGRLPVLRLRRTLAQALADGQGADVQLDLQLESAALPCANVVGRLPGRSGGPTLLLTAHYDHIGDDPGGARFPGAFDNASGVAIVLALARTLVRLPQRLPFDVRFALLTGEESGLHGARQLLARGPENIAAAINVDSIGNEAEPLVVRLGHARHGDWLAELAAAQLPAYGVDARWISGRDDVLVLQSAGIPTLGLGQQPSRPEVNPMHTPDDRPERVHLDALHRIHDALVGLVVHLARTRAFDTEGVLP
jgi:Iap family predicted aminopeptidase